VPFEDKIKILGRRPDPVEIRQDGIFAAKGDVEGIGVDRGRRPRLPQERQPPGRPSPGMKNHERVPLPDELVPELEIPADAAENVEMRQEGGDLHAPILSKRADINEMRLDNRT